jgi:hypothetical protein
MKRINTLFKCQCGFNNELQIRKPTIFKTSWCVVDCAKCGSKTSVNFSLDPNDKTRLKHYSKLVYLSDILKKIHVEQLEAIKAKDNFKFNEVKSGETRT